ncbi:glycosyltransferase family 61 protein [Arcticibacter sp.]|jgi:hypothetical protein|uniref:glycosyltransferase family 61 protein n=1 Tax=Arcticibacter sp. TaxID=1872630 RepID=UPI00388FE94C
MKSNKALLESYLVQRNPPKNYTEGELDFCSSEFSYDTLDVSLVECRNCFVNHRGFVYDGYFRINEKSLLSPAYYAGQFNIKHYLKKVLFKSKRTVNHDHKYLLAFDEWGHTHYHWFCDTLPRIYSVKDLLKDYYLLLPGNFPYIKSVATETLDLLGLRPKGIEFIDDDELLRVENLSIVTQTCKSGYVNDRILKKISEDIIHGSGIKRAEPFRKLYISREGAGYRKVLNEDEVQEVVKSYGYEVIRYEDMSLMEQIRITASAKSIVSIHGAGLTNIVFMLEGSNVLEFRRDRIYHNQCYWHLADALNLNYFYLFGSPDDDDLVLEGNGCNLTIDTEKLTNILKQMEE